MGTGVSGCLLQKVSLRGSCHPTESGNAGFRAGGTASFTSLFTPCQQTTRPRLPFQGHEGSPLQTGKSFRCSTRSSSQESEKATKPFNFFLFFLKCYRLCIRTILMCSRSYISMVGSFFKKTLNPKISPETQAIKASLCTFSISNQARPAVIWCPASNELVSSQPCPAALHPL